MNKDKLIVANWKMNFLYNNASIFCKKISSKRKSIKNKFIICPPTALISKLSLRFNKITFGAQDCHYEKFGAFTGDNSAVMLKNINCKYIIIGHSERRKFYNENNVILKKKIKSIINANLVPIFCIGEDISVKRKGNTKKHLLNQLINVLPKNNKKKIVIAYEPIWAIGSGKTPKIEEIEEINLYIKSVIRKINTNYKNTKILYGGSVNKENSKIFLNNNNVNGLLVGGSSLDFNTFYSILSYKIL